jgi:hypothetical protein
LFRFSSFSRVRFADINFYMVSSKGKPGFAGLFRSPLQADARREASREAGGPRRPPPPAEPGRGGPGARAPRGSDTLRPIYMRGADTRGERKNRPTAQKHHPPGRARAEGAAHPEGGDRAPEQGRPPPAPGAAERPGARRRAPERAPETNTNYTKSNFV